MKWIVGGLILYLILNSQKNAAGASGPVLTNQGASGTPLSYAQRLARDLGTIAYDITGAPTTADNNTPSVGNPSSNPVLPISIRQATTNYGM